MFGSADIKRTKFTRHTPYGVPAKVIACALINKTTFYHGHKRNKKEERDVGRTIIYDQTFLEGKFVHTW